MESSPKAHLFELYDKYFKNQLSTIYNTLPNKGHKN